MPFDPSSQNQKIIDGVVILSEFDADVLGNPPVDKTFLYAEDDGLGSTVLKTKNSSGTEKTILTEAAPFIAGLLAAVDHNNPGAFTISNYINVVFAWPLVTQSSSIYSTTTGIFTLPRSGAYALNYNIVAQLPDWVAGGIGLTNLTTSSSLGGSLWIKRLDEVTFDSVASIVFVASAGDQIQLSTFNAMSEETPGSLFNEYFAPPNGINKISLYKL